MKKNNLRIPQIFIIVMLFAISSRCKKEDINSNSATDADGNVYNTLSIGTQVWMVENLKTTKLNDGTPIPNITENVTWSKLTTPAYVWYNDAAANKTTYGALYNWFTVNTGKLAPKGWHIPSDADWNTLITFLGGDTIAGGKLKEKGTNHWAAPNTGADNRSGFTALPGGVIQSDGFFIPSINYYCTFWSSSEYNSGYASFLRLFCTQKKILGGCGYSKNGGCSVRCIKN